VPSLAEIQSRIGNLVRSNGGEFAELAPLLRGGLRPESRLAIHARHYEASLSTALLDKFPGCVWLLGTPVVENAARLYVRVRAPDRPCIAEYGADFPTFLATTGRVAEFPYIEAFAKLEWLVGKVSIAVAEPAVGWSALAAAGTDSLLDSALDFQSGTHYLRTPWGVDDLLRAYLGASAPERFVMESVDTRIEIRGVRGEFTLERLDAATFAFRTRLLAGDPIAVAAERALDIDPAMDVAADLRGLAATNMIVRVRPFGGRTAK
jgi:hypothetical protein